MVLNQGSHSLDNIWGFKVKTDYLDMVHMRKICIVILVMARQAKRLEYHVKESVIIAPQDIMMDLMLRVMIFSQTIPKDNQLKIRVVFLSLCWCCFIQIRLQIPQVRRNMGL